MKYENSGTAIAIRALKRKLADNAIKNLINIYLDEKDEKNQNKLLGMIETMEDAKIYKKQKLFDKLQEYKDILQKIKNESDDVYLFEEKAYFEGCCEGIRRLIGIDKDLRNLSKKSFVIVYTAGKELEFANHSAFALNENLTGISEYKDSIQDEINYFYVTSDFNEVKNLLESKDSEHEYIVLLVYNSVYTHNIEDLKSISHLCEDNFYFVKEEKNQEIIGTYDYLKKIISKIGMK